MDLQEKLKEFSDKFGELIRAGFKAGVPVDFMANQFARAEFEMRMTALQIQQANAEKELSEKIIHVGANGRVKPPIGG